MKAKCTIVITAKDQHDIDIIIEDIEFRHNIGDKKVEIINGVVEED